MIQGPKPVENSQLGFNMKLHEFQEKKGFQKGIAINSKYIDKYRIGESVIKIIVRGRTLNQRV